MPNNVILSDTSRTLDEQETYDTVREYIVAAQKKVTVAINSAMVEAYWNIGKRIYEACGESECAEYGKGFSVPNLRNMRQFYLRFQNRNALRSELSWTHYRSLMRVEDEDARNFYLEETVKCGWSSRQLDRQINSFYYQRILASKDKERFLKSSRK